MKTRWRRSTCSNTPPTVKGKLILEVSNTFHLLQVYEVFFFTQRKQQQQQKSWIRSLKRLKCGQPPRLDSAI